MDRRDPSYAACYCEENVWHLASDPRVPGERHLVVFISNRGRCCPMWAQRSAPSPDQPAVWDYHVVLLVAAGGEALVYDLDSTVPFPVALGEYLASTFPFHDHLDVRLLPRFRVIEASEFRARFASDRSHMRDGEAWKAPPPPWPCITTDAEVMNLDRFIDMDRPYAGEVLDLVELEQRFAVQRVEGPDRGQGPAGSGSR